MKVRSKFEDVFQVKANCVIGSESDFADYSDDVSVAGRLINPKVVEFFRSIRALPLILDKLQYGHHPNFIAEVPSLQRENNGSFRKHINFATEEVKRLIAKPPEILSIFGDASSTGCGSFIQGKEVIAAKTFSSLEREAHSTWRELESVNFTLKAFLPFIKNRTVKCFVDNLASVTIAANGSMKPLCQELALQIHETFRRHSVSLSLEWIPRGKNEVADYLSRLSDILVTDDWGITPEFFRILNNKFGPFTIDCFANAQNKKVDRFFSLFYVPGTAGVNAFTFS
jgi:hypothetical protein